MGKKRSGGETKRKRGKGKDRGRFSKTGDGSLSLELKRNCRQQRRIPKAENRPLSFCQAITQSVIILLVIFSGDVPHEGRINIDRLWADGKLRSHFFHDLRNCFGIFRKTEGMD